MALLKGVPILGDLEGALSGERDENMPSPQSVPLDEQTSRLMSDAANEALAPQESMSPQLDRMSENMFVSPDAVSSAIQSRYRNLAKREIEGAKLQSDLNATTRKALRLQSAAERSIGSQQAKVQHYANLVNAEMAQRAARDQVRGQLLGLAGMSIGMMVGGPAGAAVGGQMGRMAAPQQPINTTGQSDLFSSGRAGGIG